MKLYIDNDDDFNNYWIEPHINAISDLLVEGDYILVKSKEQPKNFVVGYEEFEYEQPVSGFLWNLFFKPKTETKTRQRAKCKEFKGYDISIYQGGEKILKGFEVSQ